MFTKDQLNYWKSIGFLFPTDYDQFASTTVKRSLKIRYAKSTVKDQFVIIRFSLFSRELKGTQAFINLTAKGKEKYSLVASMSKKITNNTMDWEIEVPLMTILSFSGEFYLTALADTLSAESLTFDFGEIKFDEEGKTTKTCFCNRDFTTKELHDLVVKLRQKDMSGIVIAKRKPNSHKFQKDGDFVLDKDGKKITYELTFYDAPYGSEKLPLKDRIFFLGDEKMRVEDANFRIFTAELNKGFKDYKINTCIRKIHFLGQAYTETQMFTKTYESNPSSTVFGGEFYRGRGLVQLTNDFNYKAFYKVGSGNVEATDDQLKEFVPKVATHMELACQGSGWYWSDVNANLYADEDNADLVSAAVNRPKALRVKSEIDNISNLSDRVKYTDLFKNLMDYENCRNK